MRSPGASGGSNSQYGRLKRYLLRWPGRERQFPFTSIAAGAGTLLLVAISLFAVGSWIAPGGFFGVDASCNGNTFACNALTEVFATGLALAVAVASFLYWRVFRVARLHTAIGLTEPWRLVPTASHMHKVVGREAICEIIEEDLRARKKRRPLIIVGDVGEGKTAVLVRLTQLLIERGAVPVAIDLREARIPLDFQELAHENFLASVRHGLLSEDEGDKVWRKLSNDKRVVVLADCLDEALEGQAGRDPEIRRAVNRALQERLPLVLAARPNDVLRGLNAALIRLEPLSTSDAVEYMEASDDAAPEVETLAAAAAMTEAPLYLWLAQQLPENRRDVPIDEGRSAARVELLERWREGLVAGNLIQPDPDSPRARSSANYLDSEREAGLEGLELMAYVSLCDNSDEVRFGQLGGVLPADALSSEERSPRSAARVGENLDLVERVDQEGVRFRHSVLKGYLGGRAVPTCAHLHRGRHLGAAVRHPRRALATRGRPRNLDAAIESPSRELLMALTVASFRARGTDLPHRIRRKLEKAALNARAAEAFELLAAAYEIGHLAPESERSDLGRIAEELWDRSSHEDAAQLPGSRVTEAKLRAIDRMEETAGPAAYGALWTVCLKEQNYAVRLRAAQALANGGEAAHAVLEADMDRVRPADLADGSGGVQEPVRLCSMYGWILPTLAATCTSQAAINHITATLGEWVDQSRTGFHLGVEGCFAQGFKHAANRLPRRTSDATAAMLAARTGELLSASKWWYSQLTLLQALTLWGLTGEVVNRGKVFETLAAWQSWRCHPLVREAARLCEKALREAHELGTAAPGIEPSRYLWIDEAGVAGKIGALNAPPRAKSTAGLWVPRSAGWRTLEPAARTLVAEALVLLNLIEGGEAAPRPTRDVDRWTRERPQTREGRRQAVARQGTKLPPCLVEGEHRETLKVEIEHGEPRADDGSTGCCEFGLCPYPAPDEDPFRGELRETFCRGQQRLLKDRDVPPWHRARWLGLRSRRKAAKELTVFWEQMEHRAQRLSLYSMKAPEPDERRNGTPTSTRWWSRLRSSDNAS